VSWGFVPTSGNYPCDAPTCPSSPTGIGRRVNLFSQISLGGCRARIVGHPEIIEDQPHTALKVPHFLRHTVHPFGFDEADREPSEPRDVFRTVAGPDAAPVFIEVPVENVVATILDAPMPPIGCEDLLGCGLVWRSARDAIDDVGGAFPGCLLDALAFDDKSLPDVGEIEVGVEGTGDPNFPRFNPSMAEGGRLYEIRGLALLKVEGNILEQVGLIAFDREVVMGLPVVDQIRGERALSQQGIGGDILAVNLDGIEQRRGHRNLVGALALVGALYGQGPDFF